MDKAICTDNICKVLLIDKDKSVTSILSNRLRSVGIKVFIASDQVSVFSIIDSNKPDVILLDILVKSNTGEELLTCLKNNETSSNIPIIILSSAIDVNSKVYGLLSGANDYIVKPFRFAEVYARIKNQMRIISMQNELEIKNKELVEKNMLLQQLTMTDGLTGLYNKRYIIDRLVSDVTRFTRFKEPISFLMIDVDHFKRINDTYGHLIGDILLRSLANKLKPLVRDVDIIARYGGEEFLIVVPNGDAMGAKTLAERLRETFENLVFEIEGHNISITLSIGVNCANIDLTKDCSKEVIRLINEADTALLRAKTSGRNRVEFYDSKLNAQIHIPNESTTFANRFSVSPLHNNI